MLRFLGKDDKTDEVFLDSANNSINKENFIKFDNVKLQIIVNNKCRLLATNEEE